MEDKAQAGSLTEWDQKALALFKSRQIKLQDRKPRESLGVFLLGKTGMVERSKQRTTALSPDQEKQRIERMAFLGLGAAGDQPRQDPGAGSVRSSASKVQSEQAGDSHQHERSDPCVAQARQW